MANPTPPPPPQPPPSPGGARERVAGRRRLIRNRVATGAVAVFAAVWLGLFAQLVGGNDPGLKGTASQQQAGSGSSANTGTGSAATSSDDGGFESDDGGSASGSTQFSQSQQQVPQQSPVTTSQS